VAAVGLQTHIWANNTRSILLMALFPVLLVGIIYAAQLVMMGYGYLPSTKSFEGDLVYSARMLLGSMPLAFIGAGVWFVIAYFSNQAIIDLATGARVVDRQSNPEIYNLLENLAISRGMKTPTLRLIEQPELNAFATGLHEGQYSITVTRGLVQALNRDELEAVLAHELTHVINKDVRTMIIATVFAGIISLIAEMMFRSMRFMALGGNRRGNSGGAALALILVGFGLAAIGWLLAVVIRMSLSRRREYIADAGSVELTKNPDAMISALQKVSGRADLQAPDEVAGMFLEHRETGFLGLFATHPPIEKRIEALVTYAGGIDHLAERQKGRLPGGTAVPPTI
jgi:heat shock protein HtpX